MTQFYSGMKGPVAIAKLNEVWDAAGNIATNVASASASATAAATSATNAAASYDAFDDRYLGQKAQAPTLDNDGAALITGALYFNTTDSAMYVRTQSNTWIAVANAATSTSAATQATNAANSATSAATQATNAANSATSASTSASTATTQATNASQSATSASTSASNANTSATNAANQATSAATQATNAATSATNAAASYDAFDDRYLGQKATAPTLDNDGAALLVGALYFNTTDNNMYVRTASSWVTVSNNATQISADASATNAAAQATTASGHSTKASLWADANQNVQVETGKYSAKHWALQAQATVTGSLIYRGAWSAASGTYPAVPALGDYYKVSVAGTVSSILYNVNDSIIYNGTGWDLIDSTEQVTSVAGKVGAVTLVKGDVGLGNVDNTADSAKSVASAATLTTARTINGVSFNGSTNISVRDIRTVYAGAMDALTTDGRYLGYQQTGSASDTISVFDTRVYSPDWIIQTQQVPTSTPREYVRARYNGTTWSSWVQRLTSGNFNEFAPSLTGTGASGNWPISVTGNAATASAVAWQGITSKPTTLTGFGITDATPSSHVGTGATAHANVIAGGSAGFMTGEDKTKLDGIAANATNYTHPANHPPSIITQDASNRFVTDAEKTEWSAKGDVTLTGTQTLTNKTLTGAVVDVVRFSSQFSIISAAYVTANFANGQKQLLTLTAATTVAFSFPGVGNYQLILTQDATGNRTVTWTGVTRYVGSATAPAINIAANTSTIVSIYYDGTNVWLAAQKVNA